MKEGYLMIDHRASPGIPAEMARAMGFDPKLVGEGKIFEAPSYTCLHCRGAVWKDCFRVEPLGFCQKCGGGFVCDGCVKEAMQPLYKHISYDMRVDIALENAARGIVVPSLIIT